MTSTCRSAIAISIIATHGRSLYVIDDVGGLELLTPAVRAEPAHLFPPRPALGFVAYPGFVDSNGNAGFRGSNPPEGALLTFWLSSFSPEVVKISITNAEGQPVANLTAPAVAGLNRVNVGSAAHEGCAHRVRRRGEQARCPPANTRSRSSREATRARRSSRSATCRASKRGRALELELAGALASSAGDAHRTCSAVASQLASEVDFRTVLFEGVAVRDGPFRRRT